MPSDDQPPRSVPAKNAPQYRARSQAQREARQAPRYSKLRRVGMAPPVNPPVPSDYREHPSRPDNAPRYVSGHMPPTHPRPDETVAAPATPPESPEETASPPPAATSSQPVATARNAPRYAAGSRHHAPNAARPMPGNARTGPDGKTMYGESGREPNYVTKPSTPPPVVVVPVSEAKRDIAAADLETAANAADAARATLEALEARQEAAAIALAEAEDLAIVVDAADVETTRDAAMEDLRSAAAAGDPNAIQQLQEYETLAAATPQG